MTGTVGWPAGTVYTGALYWVVLMYGDTDAELALQLADVVSRARVDRRVGRERRVPEGVRRERRAAPAVGASTSAASSTATPVLFNLSPSWN